MNTWGAFGGCISLRLPDPLPALCRACPPGRAQADRCQHSQCCSGGFRGSGCICSGMSANPRHCCALSGSNCSPSCLEICIHSPISKYILLYYYIEYNVYAEESTHLSEVPGGITGSHAHTAPHGSISEPHAVLAGWLPITALTVLCSLHIATCLTVFLNLGHS